MTSNSVSLNITPLKPQALPSTDAIIEAGKQLLEESTNGKIWVKGKTFPQGVSTFRMAKRPQDGAPWHMRVSVHTEDDATFDQFWGKLGNNKAENEKQFVHEIAKVTKIMEISETQSIWSMYYKFPPPVAPRVFTVLQSLYYSKTSPRTGIIVSVPVDLSGPENEALSDKEEQGVAGRYVSVERIVELEDGKTEWRMATSSSPGGNIPGFVAELSMAKSIASDVPRFLEWLNSQ